MCWTLKRLCIKSIGLSVTVTFEIITWTKNKSLHMPYFLNKRTSKSRKVHNRDCCICLCRFCCALRRPKTSCDSLTKVPVEVLKRYNYCLWSFKYKLFFDRWPKQGKGTYLILWIINAWYKIPLQRKVMRLFGEALTSLASEDIFVYTLLLFTKRHRIFPMRLDRENMLI